MTRFCSIEGCDRLHYGRGWCNMHYKRWWKHGDPLHERSQRTCSIKGCDLPHQGLGLCNKHYQRWYNHGDVNADKRSYGGEPLRFVEMAVASDTDDCLLWPFGTDAGYGILIVEDRKRRATHIVLENSGQPRPAPPEDNALHSCPGGDNPACINPRHLRWGTKAENLQDAIERGGWDVDRHVPVPRGENNGHAKLTDDNVRDIRSRYAAGEATQALMAKEYGVSSSVISEAISGKTWGHVQ